ncbi:MAG: hypothetical protein IPL59_16750 [Candidatus Competibacteraceae bacterium]|nr:hypothetical protein [Candidatus Competibacteraceae bacterium]
MRAGLRTLRFCGAAIEYAVLDSDPQILLDLAPLTALSMLSLRRYPQRFGQTRALLTGSGC